MVRNTTFIYAQLVKENRKNKDLKYPLYVRYDNKIFLLKRRIDEADNSTSYAIDRRVCNAISITEIRNDIITKEKVCTLRYINLSGNEEEKEVSAELISDKSKIVSLSKYGVDINTKNSEDVICHLNNEMRKAVMKRMISQAGIVRWHNRFYYVGNKAIYKSKTLQTIKETSLQYVGKLNISQKGSYEKYQDMLKRDVLKSRYMSLALAIGASSLIIGYIGNKLHISNLLIHISGESSSGKSTALQLALSVFGGVGSADGKNSLFSSWNTTENAMIEMLANNMGIAVGLDEAGMSKSKEFASLIYRLAEGKEKQRMEYGVGNKDIREWHTTIISTGEFLLDDVTDRATGQRVRLINLQGIPWTESAQHSQNIKSVLQGNYGFLGEMLARKLLERTPKYWYDRHHKEVEMLLPFLKCGVLNDRVANHLAVISLSAGLLRRVGVGVSQKSVRAILVAVANDTMGENSSIGERAFEKLKEAIARNQNKIEFRSHNGSPIRTIPMGDIWGVSYFQDVPKNSSGSLDFDKMAMSNVSIQKETLDDFLRSNGFKNTDIIYNEWQSSGHLVMGKDNRLLHKVKMGNVKSALCVRIKL